MSLGLSRFFRLRDTVFVANPSFTLLDSLIQHKNVYVYKFGYPRLCKKIIDIQITKLVDKEILYVTIDKSGLFDLEFFNGVFYKKWFWQNE